MTTPFRASELKAPEAPVEPKLPLFWRLRVWWASRHVRDESGEKWCIEYIDTTGRKKSLNMPWSDLEFHAARWEKTPDGEPLAIRVQWPSEPERPDEVILAHPACVPTMVRLIRTAADAASLLPKVQKAAK